MNKYKKALLIACGLNNGDIIYGIDSEKLFKIVMEKYGFVSGEEIADYIVHNLDRFSDDDNVRNKAIKKLGY